MYVLYCIVLSCTFLSCHPVLLNSFFVVLPVQIFESYFIYSMNSNLQTGKLKMALFKKVLKLHLLKVTFTFCHFQLTSMKVRFKDINLSKDDKRYPLFSNLMK